MADTDPTLQPTLIDVIRDKILDASSSLSRLIDASERLESAVRQSRMHIAALNLHISGMLVLVDDPTQDDDGGE